MSLHGLWLWRERARLLIHVSQQWLRDPLGLPAGHKRLTAEKAFKRDGFPKKRLLQRMDCEGKRMGFLNKRDGFPKKRPLTKNGNP